MKKDILKIFNAYYLHDVGVQSFIFNFEKKEIEVKFRIWDDLQKINRYGSQ